MPWAYCSWQCGCRSRSPSTDGIAACFLLLFLGVHIPEHTRSLSGSRLRHKISP
ncbi:hypothetical protein HMPREF1981_00610 [Bacteroides pyogenes F0041]|uniref:Uncharacterized protein n=1 Tax=Bacteroides pyogenes F0041 TaxID=1321819 RepID=U2E709_9BACE|nr:hypothetical protein HMPREF1981_00610 [Bacteroides pyogenes F0041]